MSSWDFHNSCMCFYLLSLDSRNCKVSVKSVKGAISYDTFIKVIAVCTVRYYRARSYESIIFQSNFECFSGFSE